MRIKFTGGPHPRKIHKMVIAGTGRAGTTFLVQLLTALGIETGFKDIHDGVYENCHAGMEKDIREPSSPYIVKSPSLCDTLAEVMASGNYVIDHLFIPIRDLEAAAMSRISVSSQAQGTQSKWRQRLIGKFKHKKAVPGGLIDTDNPQEQLPILAEKLYRLIYAVSLFDIPHTLLHFPKLTQDPRYLYQKLAPIVGDMDYPRFKNVFDYVVQPALVHDFPVFSLTL